MVSDEYFYIKASSISSKNELINSKMVFRWLMCHWSLTVVQHILYAWLKPFDEFMQITSDTTTSFDTISDDRSNDYTHNSWADNINQMAILIDSQRRWEKEQGVSNAYWSSASWMAIGTFSFSIFFCWFKICRKFEFDILTLYFFHSFFRSLLNTVSTSHITCIPYGMCWISSAPEKMAIILRFLWMALMRKWWIKQLISRSKVIGNCWTLWAVRRIDWFVIVKKEIVDGANQ